MATVITKRLEFDAGHRVLGHEGKCKFLHGHRYSAEVTVTAPDLDKLGRVIDFGVIKREVGGWIDNCWDHQLLLNPEDPLLKADLSLLGKPPYVMAGGNPTAENMARELYDMAIKLLPNELKVVRVRIWETPTCFAEFSPEG